MQILARQKKMKKFHEQRVWQKVYFAEVNFRKRNIYDLEATKQRKRDTMHMHSPQKYNSSEKAKKKLRKK